MEEKHNTEGTYCFWLATNRRLKSSITRAPKMPW